MASRVRFGLWTVDWRPLFYPKLFKILMFSIFLGNQQDTIMQKPPISMKPFWMFQKEL